MKKTLLIALASLCCAAAYGQEKYILKISEVRVAATAVNCGGITYTSAGFTAGIYVNDSEVYQGEASNPPSITGVVYEEEVNQRITSVRLVADVDEFSLIVKEELISTLCADNIFQWTYSPTSHCGPPLSVSFNYTITPVIEFASTTDNTRTANDPLNIQAPTGFGEEVYNWEYKLEGENSSWQEINPSKWNDFPHWEEITEERCSTRSYYAINTKYDCEAQGGTFETEGGCMKGPDSRCTYCEITTCTPGEVTARGITKDVLTASFADFLSEDERAANYYKNIRFRVNPYSCDDDMPQVSYVLIPDAPNITAEPLSVRCPGDTSVQLMIKFKKEELAENGKLLLTITDPTLRATTGGTNSAVAQISFARTANGGDNISHYPGTLEAHDLDSDVYTAYTWTIPLIPKKYELSYQTVSTADTSLFSALAEKEITFPVPDTLTFTATPRAVACHGDSTGRIEFTAQGGTPGDYQYKYQYNPPSTSSYTDWASFTTGQTTGSPEKKATTTLTALPAGRYTLQVQDTNRCAALPDGGITITITQPADSLAVAFAVHVNATFYGAQNGQINATIQGGTPHTSSPPYTTAWQKDISAVLGDRSVIRPTLQGDTYAVWLDSIGAGHYTLTATDSNNCTAYDTTTVTQPEPLAVTLSITQRIGCNASNASQHPNSSSNGKLTATATGGMKPYTYSWQRSDTAADWSTLQNQTDSTLTDLSPGTYRVVVRDKNYTGATTGSPEKKATTTLPAPDTLTFTATPRAVACHGDSTGRIELTAQGGTPGDYQYKYQYNPPSTSSNTDWASFTTGQTTSSPEKKDTTTLTALPAGRYTLQVQDTNRCAALPDGGITIRITQPADSLAVTLSVHANATFYGAQNGQINATIQGGTPHTSSPPYTTAWQKDISAVLGGVISSPRQGDTYAVRLDSIGAGHYTLTATDSNNCTAHDTTTVTQPEPLAVTLSITQRIGCNASNASQHPNSSSNGKLTATATGGVKPYTYSWQRSDTAADWSTLQNQTDNTLTDLSPGTYRVVVRDKNYTVTTPGSPEEKATTTLPAPDTLTFTATPRAVVCHGDSTGRIELTAQGGTPGYQYSYSPTAPTAANNGNYTAWAPFEANQATLPALPAGRYTLQVQDTNRCFAPPDGSTTIRITQPAAPLAIALVTQDVAFYGGNNGHITATLTGGTPPYTTAWQKENTPFSGGLRTTDSTTASLSNTGTGSYTLTATDSHNCTAHDTTTVTQPEPLSVTLSITQQISCSNSTAPAAARDGLLTATATGGVKPYTYSWQRKAATGAWKALSVTLENTLANSGPGEYKILLTDAHHAAGSPTREATATLLAPPPIEFTLAGTEASCQNGNDGKIVATITGGTSPLTMEWNTTTTTTTITPPTRITLDNLTSGLYVAFVTDGNGCTVEASQQLGSPEDLVANHTAQHPTCPSSNDGTLAVNITGGAPPYTLTWNTGATSPTLTGLGRGAYSCTITDGNNCTTYVSTQLEDPAAITVSLGADRTLCNGQTHAIDITLAEGQATYLWESSDGPIGTTPTVILTHAGTYKARLTTSAGCVSTDTIQITTLTTTIDANFMITTQAFANEDLVLVNTSKPLGERTEWTFPPLVTTTAQTANSRILRFSERGIYKITMRTFQGPCYQDYTKSIVVDMARDMPEVGDLKAPLITAFSLYPNPSTDVFTLSVTLSKVAPISLRLFNMITPTPVDDRRLSGSSEYTEEYELSLPGGMYFMLLEVGKERQIRKVLAQ